MTTMTMTNDYDQSLLVSNTIVLLDIFLHDDPQFAR